MRRFPQGPLGGLILALCLAGAAGAGDWTPLDAEKTLVIDTSRGRIVVALQPEFAPRAVARIKTLAHDGVYDGLLFHRVIDGFVDQTGNPNNHDGGGTALPDLDPEFTFPTAGLKFVPVRQSAEVSEGFIGASPVALDQKGRGWGIYCAGTAGMGRQEGPHTANSEIFFMRDPARRLDHDYTVWGQVVQGLDLVRSMAVGEPPVHPDRMIRVRLAAELDPGDQPALEIMDPNSPAFRKRIAEARRAQGADLGVCDLAVPVRSRP